MNDSAPHESLKDLIKSPKGRDVFYIIGGLASILGLYLYLHNGSRGGQSVSSLSGTGTGGVSPDQSTLIDKLNQQVQALKDAAKVGTNVEFKFGTDDSQASEAFGTFGNVSTTSGGGGISITGIGSAGGSGGHSGSSGQVADLKHTNSDVFSADVVLQNASDATIQSVQAFLTNIVGTKDQRLTDVLSVETNNEIADLNLTNGGLPGKGASIN